jgi:uncharacterized protein
MKRILKITLWSLAVIAVFIIVLIAGFIYKVKNGFPVSYETEAPAIDIPDDQTTVLLFSKATGFRHGESIETGKKTFAKMAKENNWFLYSTEEGGIFNAEQLSKFDVVIFNNSTGRVLNDNQQLVLEEYVTGGGTLIGIHGAGDDSHHWDWYEQSLMGSRFSHHPIDPQLQETELILNEKGDSTLVRGLPRSWKHTDEWYVFYENPRTKGFELLYTIDGEKIDPSGNMLWINDKNFGMGKDHPIAWYKVIGSGRTFYTSLGHTPETWQQSGFTEMLGNVVNWATR